MALKKKKEDIFFTLFKDYALSISKMGDCFGSFIKSFPADANKNAEMLKAFESECDGKKHRITDELNNSFVTPFDREDIFALADKMDDVADFIEDIASKFLIYDIREMTEPAKEMAEIIVEVTKNIEIMLTTFTDKSKTEEVKKAVIALNNLEDKGDVIYRNTLSAIFRDSEMGVKDLIRWKDMYELLEAAVDSGEHLADVVEGIMTKNA